MYRPQSPSQHSINCTLRAVHLQHPNRTCSPLGPRCAAPPSHLQPPCSSLTATLSLPPSTSLTAAPLTALLHFTYSGPIALTARIDFAYTTSLHVTHSASIALTAFIQVTHSTQLASTAPIHLTSSQPPCTSPCVSAIHGWMWLQLMWLQFEAVRGPVGVVWTEGRIQCSRTAGPLRTNPLCADGTLSNECVDPCSPPAAP